MSLFYILWRLKNAASLVALVTVIATSAQAQSQTQWRDINPEPEVTAPVEKSLTEVEQLLKSQLSELIQQIDGLETGTQGCIAAAARLAGVDNDRERTSCMIQHEASKIDLFINTQDVIANLSRELFGVSEAYRRDVVALEQAKQTAAAQKVKLEGELEALRSGTLLLLENLDPDKLSRDEEQNVRDAIRAFEMAEMDRTSLASEAHRLNKKFAYAVANQDGLEDWSYAALNSAKDIDVDIKRSELRIKDGLGWAELQAEQASAKGMPIALARFGTMLERLAGLRSEPFAFIPPEEDDPIVIARPKNDHAQLIASLKSLLGEPAKADMVVSQ